MLRRDLLRSGAAILALLHTRGFAQQFVRELPRARVRPGDAAWPGIDKWEQLNAQTGGNLIKVESLYAPCRDLQMSRCVELLENVRNPFYRGDQPGATQVSGWLDAWTPQPSVYAVHVRNAADVAAAVTFARENNLRLVIKGAGHSYQGTSNAPDSLLIWTRAMNRVELHDAFVPMNCNDAPVPAVTVEAGAVWIDAYDAVTTKAGRYVQGGGCADVGVAGLIQSGGFGTFSKGFGTAAGGLLEAEIVTADSRIRTVNARRDADLFWAIKGGGGGSWGVITKLTLRTHELPKYMGYAGATIRATSDAAFRALITRFVTFYAGQLCNPHWGESVKVNPENVLEVGMVCQGLSGAQTTAAWQPFFEWARANGYTLTDVSTGAGDARSWWDIVARQKRGSEAMVRDPRPGAPPHHAWWRDDQDQVGAFLYGFESIWLPTSLLQKDRLAHLVEALFAASRHWQVQLHFNKGLAGAPADAVARSRDTATNPAVLDAFALAIVANGGPPFLPDLPYFSEKAHADARAVDAAVLELITAAPERGSYVSESNYFNRDWQRAFWGPNYARLRAVKDKYDPLGLFFVHHGVGSEAWSADGFTPRRG